LVIRHFPKPARIRILSSCQNKLGLRGFPPEFEEEVRVRQGDAKKGGAGRKTVQRIKENANAGRNEF